MRGDDLMAKNYTDTDGNKCSLTVMCMRETGWAASRIRSLTEAVEAGLKAFEFLGERMNEADGAAGEAKTNLDTLAKWVDIMRIQVPKERRREMLAEVYPMLELDAADDPEDGDS